MHSEPEISVRVFLNSIMEFNQPETFSKSYNEILQEGLNVYMKLPNFILASFFIYNKEKFEFVYESSTDVKDEKLQILMFDKLNESGGLPKALSELETTEWELTNRDGEILYFLIIPLVGAEGVFGVNIICLSSPVEDKSLILPICRLHSNNFALKISNSLLFTDLTRLKEITEEKIALSTRDIVQSTQELRLILDSVQAGLIMYEFSSRLITNVNTTASRLIGAPAEQIAGSLRNEIYFSFSPIAVTDIPLNVNEEVYLKTSNGALIPVIRTTEMISLGEDIYYLDSFIDISDRKIMEDDLQRAHFELERRVEERTLELSVANDELKKEIQSRIKAEEEVIRLYWAVHQNPASIIITDTNGIVEYVNPRFTVMTGYSYTEIVGNTMRILKSDDLSDDEYKILWETITSGKEWRGEYRNKKKDGQLFWVSSTISPIRNLEGEISNYLSIQEDITEKKKAYEELISAKEKAESADKLKTSLLANMNHEFRTPLIGILGFSQLLMLEELDNEIQFMIQGINSSGKRLLNTLNGVLTLSEKSTSSNQVQLERVNLNEIIPFAVRDFKARAEEKGLGFEFIVKRDTNLVLANTEKLNTALGNVIDNAIKYTPAGHIKIISDTVERDNKKFGIIQIVDTGIGIDDKDLEIIFEAFRQASEGYSRNYEGCGLGLTLADQAVKEMNGQITVTSRLSQGSEFTIFLPSA